MKRIAYLLTLVLLFNLCSLSADEQKSGFAFFKDTTEGWTFAPEPVEEPVPPEYFEREPYVEFDKTLPASNIKAVNAQQAARNASFAIWLKRIKDALAAVDVKMEFNVIRGGLSWYVLPDMAEVRAGSYHTFLSLYGYDAWSPGEIAEQIRRDSRKLVELKE